MFISISFYMLISVNHIWSVDGYKIECEYHPQYMLKDSFWYPNTPRKAVFIGLILVMIVLHGSAVVGLVDSTTLVFGWLPAQIAYDAAFNLIGAVILYGMYRAAPSPPAEHEPTATPTRSDMSARTGGDD
jgi:hypothetical protein